LVGNLGGIGGNQFRTTYEYALREHLAQQLRDMDPGLAVGGKLDPDWSRLRDRALRESWLRLEEGEAMFRAHPTIEAVRATVDRRREVATSGRDGTLGVRHALNCSAAATSRMIVEIDTTAPSSLASATTIVACPPQAPLDASRTRAPPMSVR
jgi:hypothetical protein